MVLGKWWLCMDTLVQGLRRGASLLWCLRTTGQPAELAVEWEFGFVCVSIDEYPKPNLSHAYWRDEWKPHPVQQNRDVAQAICDTLPNWRSALKLVRDEVVSEPSVSIPDPR
jgi:hypothetical protein